MMFDFHDIPDIAARIPRSWPEWNTSEAYRFPMGKKGGKVTK